MKSAEDKMPTDFCKCPGPCGSDTQKQNIAFPYSNLQQLHAWKELLTVIKTRTSHYEMDEKI